MKQKRSKNKNKQYLALGLSAIVIVAALLFWLWPSGNNTKSDQDSNSGNSSNSGINYGPATPTEKQESQNAKSQDLSGQDNQPPVDSSGKKQVQIQVISATTSQVRANVIGVFEDNGKCTATFTRGSENHSFSSYGLTSSNYTQCAPINVTGITGSGWTVVVSYSSDTSSGQSQPVIVN